MWRASCVGDSVRSLSIAVWSVDGRRRTPTLGAQAVHSGSPLFSGQAGSGESDLPGEGLGSKTEPVTDKLSALIEVMNEKFGADLDESDKLVFEQTHMDIMRRDDLRIIAKGNDREHYQLALTDVVDDIFLSRGNRNAQIVEAYYAHPEIRDAFIDFVSTTWEDFRAAAK